MLHQPGTFADHPQRAWDDESVDEAVQELGTWAGRSCRREPVTESTFHRFGRISRRSDPHPVPGIRMRVLSVNRDNGYATLLLDVDPGTRFPAHHHAGAEECYVVSGAVYTWGRRLGPGDFLHADAGTDHGELWTDVGAQVILIVPPDDDVPNPAG